MCLVQDGGYPGLDFFVRRAVVPIVHNATPHRTQRLEAGGISARVCPICFHTSAAHTHTQVRTTGSHPQLLLADP